MTPQLRNMVSPARGPMSASVVIFTSVAAVAALRWALAPIVGERLPFVLWMFAIIVSALRGGALAGSAATLLSALAAVVLFEPVGTLRIDSREDVMALLIFILVGVTTSVFLGRLRSERMRAAAASVDLTRSEERFRALIERGSDVLTISDREGRITFASPSVETVCGYSVEEFQSTHPFERIHPDDVPRCRAAFEDLVRHPGRSITLEHRYCHGDGSWHWLEGTFTSLFHDPAIEGLVANFRDVTERKKVELRESLLARVSETLASTLDYQTTLMQTANLLVVGGFADWCLVDLRVEDGALERVAASHADPERAEDVEALRTQFGPAQRRQVEIERVIETGEPIMRAEIPADMRERVGSDEVFSAVVERLGLSSYIIAPLTARGTVFGALSIIASGRAFDETDLDLASEFGRRAGYTIENARLYREAHAANQSKDDFLAVLSHELRTPLTSILGWASMLRMETVDPETTRAGIVAIEQSARAQARLVDDLLDVSRIVTGRLRLDQTRIDLGVVARETAEMLRSTAEEKGLHLRVNLPPSQAMVRGDWGRLRQVIGNILANAAKFTAAGGTVSLDLATQDKRAVLTVTDTGEGITAEFLPHVFERFRQADPNSAKYGGMGLGLAIAKQLVELHGGTITVSSDGRGHGAAFRVSIPLVTATDGTPMIGG